MKTRYVMFAGYNAWANERLYDAAAHLSDADYRADRGAFFKSMHGTLNHLVVADRIWMHRFTGTGDAPTQLNAILYDDFAALREARRAEDKRIVSYIDGLSEADFAGRLRYRTITNPATIEQELSARARPFLQPPDPPPRAGARPAHGDHRRCALVRPDHVPARGGARRPAQGGVMSAAAWLMMPQS